MNFNPIRIYKIERLFLGGQYYARQEDFDSAINSFDKAISVDPNYANIYLHKALALSDIGRYSESLKCISKSIKLNPKNFAYYLFAGRICYDHQNYNEALQYIEKSLEIESTNEFALGFKGLILLSLDKMEEGIEILKSININSLNQGFQSRLLFFCESFICKYEKFNKIEKNEQTILNRFLDYTIEAEIRIFTAILSLKFEELVEKGEISVLERIKLTFKKIMLIFKGRKLERNIPMIETDYLKWIEKFPPLINYYITLIRTYPEIQEIREYLGKVYFDFNPAKIELNSEEIKKMMRIPSIIMFSGILLYCLKRVDEAIEKLIQVVENDPQNYLPLYLLGQWCIGLERYKEAQNWFEKSVSNINHNITKNRLNRMIDVWKINNKDYSNKKS